MTLDLQPEQIYINTQYLASAKENPLLRRVAQEEYTLEAEVRDLFYFNQEGNRWRKFVPFYSPLRADHDQRAKDLGDILNGMDLITPDERIELEKAKEKYEVAAKSIAWGEMLSGERMIKLNPPKESNDRLNDTLFRGVGYLMGYCIGGLGIGSALNKALTKGSLYDIVANVIIGGAFSGLGGLFLTLRDYFADYAAALEKSKRADQFIRLAPSTKV